MSSNRPPIQESANNEKNIYIPSFIAAKPFYVGDSESDYLEHQRLKAEPKDTLDKAKWYERGRKLGPAATKYRKGACENCGAMTHKTKECLSRPRKHGAKWTGKDIQADESIDKVNLGWDAKRDRWNGYDAREYDAVVKEYEDLESLRQSAAKSKTPGEQTGEDGEKMLNDDSAKYAEETDMGRSQPTSTRQLRLREDTAKYLLNLDLESAKYDPKTRSMDVDSSSLQPSQTGEFEGFARPGETSSDAAAFERAQHYAWETQEGANKQSGDSNVKKLHLQANPTEGEFLLKKKTVEDAERKAAQRKALLDKYGDASINQSTSTAGGSTTTSRPPKAITTSAMYIEYDKYGAPKLPHGQVKPKARSKYAEDILTNNHTSVWGSHWENFTWGYACCHSFVRNSYCTGDAGRIAFQEANGLRTGETLDVLNNANHPNQSPSTPNDNDRLMNGGNNGKIEKVSADEAEKLQLEQNGEDIRERKDVSDADTAIGETQMQTQMHTSKANSNSRSKRAFDEMQGSVTADEMEAYKRNRMAADDPMRQFDSLADGV